MLTQQCPACHKAEHRVKTCAHCGYRYHEARPHVRLAVAGYVGIAAACWYPITYAIVIWSKCEMWVYGCDTTSYVVHAMMGLAMSVIWPIIGVIFGLGKLAQWLLS